MERFTLTRSALTPNGWVLEDTANAIRCTFEAHKFNETQDFDTHADLPAQELATVMREIGEWMHDNAYFIAMPLRNAADVDVYMAQQVRCARIAKGLSKYRLSKITGISERHIGYIESGEHSVCVSLLYKISMALDTRLSIE